VHIKERIGAEDEDAYSPKPQQETGNARLRYGPHQRNIPESPKPWGCDDGKRPEDLNGYEYSS